MLFSEIRASAYRIAATAFGVLAVTLLIAALFFRASSIAARSDAASARKEASAAMEQVKAISAARDKEAAAAKRANAIAEQYERDKQHAEATARRTVDDLRAGNLRLRAQWQGCQANRLPASTGASGEPDAATDERNEGASNLVRIAAESDAQVRALQTFIRDAYVR